jgi:hypothetical protein
MIKITGFTTAEKSGFDSYEDFGQISQELLHNNSQELFGFGTPIVESSTK